MSNSNRSSIHSTPSKPGVLSSKYRKDSVDFGLGQDINRLKSSGISFEATLKIIFEIDDGKLAFMKNSIARWGLEENKEFCDEKAKLIKAITDVKEKKMYLPFTKMGNIIIKKAFEKTTDGNDIKLLTMGERSVKGGFAASRKPDVVLIPKRDLRLSKDLNRANVTWFHMLLWLEFKVFPDTRAGVKRGRRYKDDDSDNDDGDSDDSGEETESAPPTKMQKSGSSQIHSSSSKKRKANPTGSNASSASPSTNNLSKYEIQMGSYAAEMLSARGDRIYALGLLVKGNKLSLRYYHPSNVVMSDEFDFLEDITPLAILLSLYVETTVGKTGFGFNDALGFVNPFNTAPAAITPMTCELVPVQDPTLPFHLDADSKAKLEIRRIGRVFTHYSLLGRGTSVYGAELPDSQSSSSNINMVVKSSWQVTTRENEYVFIAEAREVDPEHIVQVYAYATIGDISPSDRLYDECSIKSPKYEKKELRILVERKYFMIYTIKDPKVFWDVLIQCLHCAHRIYSQKRILHRDISISNLGYYVDEQTGKFIGVFLDFDLASMGETQGPSTIVRSGTAPFMAREVLDLDASYIHNFQHELESLLCVTIWHALGYVGNTPPEQDVLEKWRRGPWEDIKLAKDDFFNKKFKTLLKVDDIDNRGRHAILLDRCFRLVEYFKETEMYAFYAEKGSIAQRQGDPLETLHPFSQMITSFETQLKENDPSAAGKAKKITYPHWLLIAGEALPDGEDCTKDCCM